MKKFGIFILIVIGIAFITFAGIGIKVAFFPVNTLDKSVDMAYDVTNKTLTGENAIRVYEWFKNKEAQIGASVANEQIAKEALEDFEAKLPESRTTWDKYDKQEYDSLNNAYLSQQKLTNTFMEEYNKEAEKVNKNIFKDSLPSNISRAYYSGKQLTR